MPLNEALVGKAYPEMEVPVTAERVTSFAEAVGEEGSLFRDPEAAGRAGFSAQVAPPTFPTILQIMASATVVPDQELGLDYTRVVHGEQEFDWKRPVVVGDVLRTSPRIAEIYAKGPNEFLVIEVEIVDASGGVVCTARSTLISRGTARRGA